MNNRPEKTDTVFTWSDFQEKLNSELAGNFGNLVNRTLAFIKKFMDSNIDKIKEPLDYKKDIEEIKNAYEDIELKKAIKLVLALSKKGNQYFQENEPWKVIKEDEEKAKNTLAVLANLVKDLSILAWPVMPKISENIRKQLSADYEFSFKSLEKPLENHKTGEPESLFKKLEDKEVKKFKEMFAGKQVSSDEKSKNTSKEEMLSKIDLRVAKIISVEKHPEAEKLYIEKIDCGNGEQRTIVSGLVPFYKPEELIGKNIVLVYNLKPAKLRGVLSSGMLLAVGKKDVGVLNCPDSKPGDKVTFEGIASKPEKEIIIEDFFSVKISAKEGIVSAEGKKLSTTGNILIDKNLDGDVK